MLELSRTVRFCLNNPECSAGRPVAPKNNGFAGWPPMRGLGRYYELDVRCAGEADHVTGYFINITHIDDAVRRLVLPLMQQALIDTDGGANVAVADLLRRSLSLLQPALSESVEEISLRLTPFYSLGIRRRDMNHAIVRQRFEFSAAHRLHVDALSADENRRVFGKCNNPSGHGHNYQLEVAVRSPINAQGHALAVEELDALVNEVVVQKLDHKHLNIDVPEFADLNPSVENIAMVIHNLLTPALRKLSVELDSVSVWETGKTVCTYRG